MKVKAYFVESRKIGACSLVMDIFCNILVTVTCVNLPFNLWFYVIINVFTNHNRFTFCPLAESLTYDACHLFPLIMQTVALYE